MNGRVNGLEPRSLRNWAPAIVAAVVFAGVIGATLVTGSDDGAAGGAGPSTSAASDQVVETTTPNTLPGFTTTTLAFEPLNQTLGPNSAGSAVEALQQRLKDLAFDPGPVDGYYGKATQAAVWAYEKLVLGVPREEATGQVTPETWAHMHGNVEILPERPSSTSTHLEVYLVPQVAVLFKDNRPALITHVSTGSGEVWTEEITIDPGTPENEGTEPIEKVLTGNSITPGGTYTFTREYKEGDGWRTGALGRMYKPVYFNYGVAVHGSSNVPNEPASHGCVRIPMHIAEYFPDLVKKGDAVFVFDGVKSPEIYGRQPPPFDQDITPTTTTIVTTTSAPTATTGPKTSTSAPGSTTAPTTTTTAASPPPSTTTTTTTVPPTTASGQLP